VLPIHDHLGSVYLLYMLLGFSWGEREERYSEAIYRIRTDNRN